MTVYTTLNDLLSRYEIVASKPHYAIFWNASRTYKLYHILDSGRCIELAVNTSQEELGLRDAIDMGNFFLDAHFEKEEA